MRSNSALLGMVFLVWVGSWNCARLAWCGVEGLDLPRMLFVRFHFGIQFLAQILSPPGQVVKIQGCAGMAQRAGGISLVVTGNVLGFEQAVTVEAENVVSKLPLASGRNPIEPLGTGCWRHPGKLGLSHGGSVNQRDPQRKNPISGTGRLARWPARPEG